MTQALATTNQNLSENLPILAAKGNSLTAREVMSQVQLIQQVMKAVMKEGEHYGKIPGCGNKPTLLKAGAEKLAHTFRLAPKYEECPGGREEDGLISYKIRCDLIHILSGQFVGSGLGACNSREKKYRSSQPWDVQNTLYKMACKRALVAAVLNATAASDIFTQDLEDMPGSTDEPPKSASHAQQNGECISEPQRKRFFAIYKSAGINDDQMKDFLLREYGIEHSKDIKKSDYETICNWAQGEAGANE